VSAQVHHIIYQQSIFRNTTHKNNGSVLFKTLTNILKTMDLLSVEYVLANIRLPEDGRMTETCSNSINSKNLRILTLRRRQTPLTLRFTVSTSTSMDWRNLWKHLVRIINGLRFKSRTLDHATQWHVHVWKDGTKTILKDKVFLVLNYLSTMPWKRIKDLGT
jgi:hypothetical protein